MIFFISIGPYRLPAGNSIRLCAKMVKERFAKRPGGSRDDGETVRYFGLSKPALPAVANHHGEGEQTSRERHDDHQFEDPPDRKPERERCKELHVAAAHQAEGEEPGEDDERARRKAKLERDVRPQLQPRAKPVRNGKRRYGECQPVRDDPALRVADGRIAQQRAKHHEANDLKHPGHRSEEHTSELQSLMRISYAVFCLKKKKRHTRKKKETKVRQKEEQIETTNKKQV